MKNSRAVVAMVAIALVIAIGAMAGRTANAATPTVDLKTAGNFSVLAGTTVTNTGPTTMNRNLGVSPGSAVTGFPPGIVGGSTHTADAVALQAQSDLTDAYVDAAGRGSTATLGDLVGLTLVGGVYTLSSLTSDLTGNLTLNGANDPNSVWIFKAPSTLKTSSTSSIMLTNGASPCNVFWQVSSSATLGTNSSFVGTILALTQITVTTGVTVNGRALARNAAVILDSNTFISSACQTGPTPPTRPSFTVAPSATPIVAPTATPIGAPTPAPTAAAAAPTAAAAAPTATRAPVAGAQVLPSTSTNDPLSPLLMLGIALAGVGFLVLRRQIRHS